MGIVLYSEILCQTRLSIAMGSPRPPAMSRHHRNLSRGGMELSVPVCAFPYAATEPRDPTQEDQILRSFLSKFSWSNVGLSQLRFCRLNLCTYSYSSRVCEARGRAVGLIRVGTQGPHQAAAPAPPRPAYATRLRAIFPTSPRVLWPQSVSRVRHLRKGLICGEPIRPGTVRLPQPSAQHGSAAPASKGRPVSLRQPARSEGRLPGHSFRRAGGLRQRKEG